MINKVNGINLTIIIPVYNGEKYIERTINSIAHELSNAIEVIIVDDGSTDGTLELCIGLASSFNNIFVLTQPNGGVSVARNHGLQHAKGEYIWFVDADDFITPGQLSILLNIAIKCDLDLLQFGFNIISANNKLCKTINLRESEILSFDIYLKEGYFKGVLWQSFIRRSCIGSVKFRENIKLWEDGLFFISFFEKIKKAKRISNKVYNYCQHDLSITHNIPFEVCLMVSDEVEQLKLPEFSRLYIDEYIAFYAALSIFSNGYKQQMLIDYLKEQPKSVQEVFFLKFIQNALTYNYGLLKEKKSKNLRLDILKRIVSINSLITKGGGSYSVKFVRFALNTFQITILDRLFCLISFIINAFVLKR